MQRFKYESFQIPIKFIRTDLEGYAEVENPIGIELLPDGEYMIRGDKKGHRKVYYHVGRKWYLIEDVQRDNGHYMCDSTKYNLFPCLPEKEWDLIKKVGWKRLTPLWRRHLFGHNFWLELREQGREMERLRLRLEKQ